MILICIFQCFLSISPCSWMSYCNFVWIVVFIMFIMYLSIKGIVLDGEWFLINFLCIFVFLVCRSYYVTHYIDKLQSNTDC